MSKNPYEKKWRPPYRWWNIRKVCSMITRYIYAQVRSVLWTIKKFSAVCVLIPGFHYHFKNILCFFKLASSIVTILIVCFGCSFVHNWATELTQRHKDKEMNNESLLSFKTNHCEIYHLLIEWLFNFTYDRDNEEGCVFLILDVFSIFSSQFFVYFTLF